MSLRAQNFEKLELILSDLVELIKRHEKLAKHNIYVKRVVSGLKLIKKSIWRIVQYSADNQLYLQSVGTAADHLNILFNILRSGQLKEEIFGLYQRCCEVLGRDFQLHLFGVGEPFGWSISVVELEKPALKAFTWVRQFINRCEQRIKVMGCRLWQNLQGKQLTFADCRRCGT